MKPTTQEIEAVIARVGALEKEMKRLQIDVANCRKLAGEANWRLDELLGEHP